jgi:four helix bundle protein
VIPRLARSYLRIALPKKIVKTYLNLEIYKEAMSLFGDVHRLSCSLQKSETYELGSQIRRACDSVATNIVEGYGRRRYKTEFIRFLTYSHASSLETICHLEKIALAYPEMKDQVIPLAERAQILSRKIHKFIAYVEIHWTTRKA